MPLIREPFVRTISCRLLVYLTRISSGMQLSRPDSPSIIVSRMSAEVGPEIKMRMLEVVQAVCHTSSAAVLVLPAPLPASKSHVVHQLPLGGIW